MSGKLRVAFFEQFKGGDTLLLAGDDEALWRLRATLDALAAGGEPRLWLEGLPFVEARGGVVVLAERTPTSRGLCSAGAAPRFTLRLSAEDWEDVALRVAALREAGGGHQYPLDYLDTADEVRLMVSQGEYDEGWWERHG